GNFELTPRNHHGSSIQRIFSRPDVVAGRLRAVAGVSRFARRLIHAFWQRRRTGVVVPKRISQDWRRVRGMYGVSLLLGPLRLGDHQQSARSPHPPSAGLGGGKTDPGLSLLHLSSDAAWSGDPVSRNR